MAKKTPTRKLSWRDIDERCIRSFPSMPSPESLHPGASTVERAALTSNPEARAIIDSYAFRFPVTLVEALSV